MSILRAAILCPAILMFAVAADAPAEEKLRWKFEKGEELNYVLDRSIDGTMSIGGNELQLGIKMAFDTTWNVQDVEDNGSAKIHLTVDRIQMNAKMPFPGAPDIDIDSAKLAGGDNPIVAQMKPLLDGLLDQPFAMTVSSLGEVTDIEFPESLKKVFGAGEDEEQGDGRRRRGRGGPGLPGLDAFSEKGIKQVIRQMVLPLPEKPLSDGVTWTQSFDNEEPGAGIQTAETTFSYSGAADKDGKKLVKIDAETELFFEPAEDATTEVELADQEGKTSILFDADAGHLVESIGEQMLVKEIFSRRGEMAQNLTEKVTLRLGKSPAPESEEEKAE